MNTYYMKISLAVNRQLRSVLINRNIKLIVIRQNEQECVTKKMLLKCYD